MSERKSSAVIVALFTGAWIETGFIFILFYYAVGRALYGRVVETVSLLKLVNEKIKVALFTGAWIETNCTLGNYYVARRLFTGAWLNVYLY